MNWLIFIHSYLWRNSIRRWIEQPLSLLSKLVVAALLGVFGAFVILGLQELGRQLDQRLTDREALTAIITEAFDERNAMTRLDSDEWKGANWDRVPGEVNQYFSAAAVANVGAQRNLSVIGIADIEKVGLVDDFYLVAKRFKVGTVVEFEISGRISEAQVIRPTEEMGALLNGREAILADTARLMFLLTRGYSQTTVLRAASLDALEQADKIVSALRKVEDRQIFIRSNLLILQELRKIRAIQRQALVWVTIFSGGILGLVFGSLAWMEFREERYLMALIRSFGVSRGSLLVHASIENVILAVAGVLLGFGGLSLAANGIDLNALDLGWLRGIGSLAYGDGWPLIAGAALGGVLAGVPVAIGLRKPLGLVLT